MSAVLRVMSMVGTIAALYLVLAHRSPVVIGIALAMGLVGTLLGLARLAFLGTTICLARCPECRHRPLRYLVVDRRLARCPACGRRWKRQGIGIWEGVKSPEDLARFRPKTEPSLPLAALSPVIDDTTCGTLLGTKRRIDLATLIKRSEWPSEGKAKAVGAVADGESTCGRLLRSKRIREGRAIGGESSPVIWDRWLDG